MKKKNSNLADYRTVARHFNDWIAFEREAKSDHTIASYKMALKLFLIDYLANHLKMANKTFDITKAFSPSTIKNWLDWLKNARKCKSQTINHRRGSLLRFLKYMGKQEPNLMTYALEAQYVQKHRISPTKVSGFTTDALKALLNAPNTSTKTGFRDCVLLSLLYSTGARINEVLTLRLRDVQTGNEGAKIPSVTFYGKGNKYRCIPLLEPTLRQMEAYLKRFHFQESKLDSYLFYSKSKGKSTPLSARAVEYRIKKYAESAHDKCSDVPLDAHSHQFRHTRATEWIKENHALPVVSSLLGHASVETTMTYLDITPDMIAEATRSVSSEKANSQLQNWKEDVDLTALFDFS